MTTPGKMTPANRVKTSSSGTEKIQYRFGIGEWYGRLFTRLTSEERQRYASIQFADEKPRITCPFLSKPGRERACWKPGGICSLRSYQRSGETGLVQLNQNRSTFRTTCPSRFEQDNVVYRWIGEELLRSSDAVPVGEVPFLQRVPKLSSEERQIQREVGRIDNVLVVPNSSPLEWCPVEKQAVYFSGKKMAHDFRDIAEFRGNGLPFPLFNRRPDYRSSGPKRLLPQLQVKVPTLSRWGKKMAVVVDEDFFAELGRIEPVSDLSNAEVIWFVVRYADVGEAARIEPSQFYLTALEDSIKALVAAVPIPKTEFENTIREKMTEISASTS